MRRHRTATALRAFAHDVQTPLLLARPSLAKYISAHTDHSIGKPSAADSLLNEA